MLPRRAWITEVVTRDGFQSEPQFVPTDVKIELIQALMACGVPRIEATSFVSPKAVPQLADAEQVIAGLPRPRAAQIAALVPNARGAQRAAEAGVDEIVCIVSASESHNQSNLNSSIAATLDGCADIARVAESSSTALHGGIACAFGCPFEGDVPVARVVEIAGSLHRLGVQAITLGDTTGMSTPPIVERTCSELRSAYPDLELTLHFHNTRGIGLVNVHSALQLGIDRFESTCGGLGGCPFAPGATGNVCTEDLVYLLNELGIETGVSLNGLIDVAARIETLFGRRLPGQVMRAGPRLRPHAQSDVRRALS